MTYPTFKEEEKLWNQGYKLIAGVDEVGRGALAGPVVAAAVVFRNPRKGSPLKGSPCKLLKAGLRDSKLLSPSQRERLVPLIKETAVAWAVAEVSVEVINRQGIGSASQQAMVKAVKSLSPRPDFSLVDFYTLKNLAAEKQKAIKFGDRLCASIAAASILAKVYRDRLMVALHQTYPEYGFARHKGYGTALHQEALARHGPCRLHRTGFLPNRLWDNRMNSVTPDKSVW